MRKILMSTAIIAGLAGCASGPNANDTANAIACATALLDSGVTDPGALVGVAVATPACQALASDVLSQIIANVAPKNQARALRGGR